MYTRPLADQQHDHVAPRASGSCALGPWKRLKLRPLRTDLATSGFRVGNVSPWCLHRSNGHTDAACPGTGKPGRAGYLECPAEPVRECFLSRPLRSTSRQTGPPRLSLAIRKARVHGTRSPCCLGFAVMCVMPIHRLAGYRSAGGPPKPTRPRLAARSDELAGRRRCALMLGHGGRFRPVVADVPAPLRPRE